MKNRWQEIWNKRERIEAKYLSTDISEFELFCELKRLNGFDLSTAGNETQAYKGFIEEWESMLEHVITHVGKIESAYEVGCGDGVNLMLFQNRIKGIRLGGCDYSDSLICTAKELVASDDLTCGEARSINVDDKYDLVFSYGVFQYFESEEYAADVLCRMIEKSSHIVYVEGICDREYEEEQLAARREKIKDYDKLYEGLGRRFYAKEWFEEIARSHNKQIEFTQSLNEAYVNSRFLFNCYIY